MNNRHFHSQVNSALFVDFDNIYISLQEQDRQAAERFAQSPDRWLSWLEQNLPVSHLGPQIGQRRILVRRCYLNPQSFAEFRRHFSIAAFEVVDCPPLTRQQKTSADIHMVIDILDLIDHPIQIDEFIILSADSDFSPVLVRLRKFNRYSSVLPIGFVSPAYRASCDYLISQDDFIHDALGLVDEDLQSVFGPVTPESSEIPSVLLAKMAARLYDKAVLSEGIASNELPDIYKEFPEFRQGNHWLGVGSLRRLTEVIVGRRDDLEILRDEDPWRVIRSQKMLAPMDEGSVAAEIEQANVDVDEQALKEAIAERIRRVVQESSQPVPMASLAHEIRQRFGRIVDDTHWLQAGYFKNLLNQLDLGDLKIAPIGPSYVYDPRRHEIHASSNGIASSPLTQPLDDFSLRYPEIAPLASKIHQITEMPYLLPDHYAILLKILADDVNRRGYNLVQTGKNVRDRCQERGAPVARSHVNFVLRGIYFSGHSFGTDHEDAGLLGQHLENNAIELTRAAQWLLSDEEKILLHSWIFEKLDQTEI